MAGGDDTIATGLVGTDAGVLIALSTTAAVDIAADGGEVGGDAGDCVAPFVLDIKDANLSLGAADLVVVVAV